MIEGKKERRTEGRERERERVIFRKKLVRAILVLPMFYFMTLAVIVQMICIIISH
jgi:hypothetical protein